MKKFFLMLAVMLQLVVISSCGSDNDEPSQKVNDQALNVDATYQIPGNPSGWNSDNKYIASVSDKGLVTANLMGTTRIANGKSSFKVTVKPTMTIYKEPIFEWGKSKSSVKSAMSSYSMVSETDAMVIYENVGDAWLYSYSFKGNSLSAFMALIRVSDISKTRLTDYLMQRYVPVTYEDSNIYMMTPDRKTAVLMTADYMNSTLVYQIFATSLDGTKTRAAVEEAALKAYLDEAAARHLNDVLHE